VKNVAKCAPLRIKFAEESGDKEIREHTIICSPIGFLKKQSFKELESLTELPKNRVACHGRYVVDPVHCKAYFK
jgi:hypothetical protein